MNVVVVGGGISGLATAHALVRSNPAIAVRVLEKGPSLGGNIQTIREDGFTIDAGPDSWVVAKSDATKLAQSLGLGSDLIGTRPENRRALIAWGKELHPLPEGFVLGVPTSVSAILKTPLFSARAKVRMLLEPLVPRRVPRDEADDESIEAFIRRRLGPEVASRLVAPLLGGIYGGDAGALSMRATLPQFLEMERKHGSLIHATQAAQRTTTGGQRGKPSLFTSLRGGVGTLVDRLAAFLGERIETGADVRRVARLHADERGRFAVEVVGRETLYADHVVVAAPAHAAESIVRPLADRLATLLAAIPYVSTAIVFLAYRRSDVTHPLDATGYIVPRVQDRPALAATWVSSKWDDRAPEGEVLLRVFLGGSGHEAVVNDDDEVLVRLAREELTRSIGLTATPTLRRVFRFVRASPQPLVGHPARMQAVRTALLDIPGLHLVASGYDGVGIPDCVRQAENVARSIV